MATWLVSYKFKGDRGWINTSQYVEAISPDLAKAKVATILVESGYKFEILSVRIVGEGR